MGFLDGLGKLIQGKPVFEVPQDIQDSPSKDDDQQRPLAEQTPSSGPKIIPTVVIERSEYSNSGSSTRLTARIKNQSQNLIELDKIRLLGTSIELDGQLRAGESREFNIFEGNRPNHDNYDDAYLVYKNDTGDYFESYHTVEFRKENDDTYNIYSFRFVGPVRDV